MSSRRRRHDRRARRSDHPEPPPPPKVTAKKADVRRRAAFDARMTRVKRIRTVVGLVGFLPLLASLLCGGGADIVALCGLPREVYLGVWAAIFGTFLGLTIRLWRERRDFERGGAAA